MGRRAMPAIGTRRRAVLARAVLIPALLAAPCLAQDGAPAQPESGETRAPEAVGGGLPAMLGDASLDESARTEAAWKALASGASAPLAETIATGEPALAFEAVCAALSGMRTAPEGFTAALERAVASGPPEAVGRLLSACSGWVDRDVVRLALRAARERDDVRVAAARALTEMTGRRCDPVRLETFEAWWSEVEWLPEPEWRRRVAQSQGRRAAGLAREVDALAETARSLYGRLFGATPSEQRDGLLVEMLENERVRVKRQALTLIERSLLNAQAPGDGVTGAVAALLENPDATLRAAAARTLSRMPSARAAGRALEALEVEPDPVAAAALLEAASRRPSAALAEAARRWLGEAASRRAAMSALTAAVESGVALPETTRRAALEAAGGALGGEGASEAARLLGAIGGHEAAAALSSALEDGPEAARRPAAEALARRDDGVGALVRAIERGGASGEAARAALSEHGASGAALNGVLGCEALGEQRVAIAARIARRAPAEAALEEIGRAPDPAVRTALLTAVGEEIQGARLRLRVAMALLESALLAERDDAAVRAIELLPSEAPERAARAARARVLEALAGGGGELQSLPGAPEAWIDALERLAGSSPEAARALIDSGRAAAIAGGAPLSERVDRLAERLSGAPASGPSAGS